LAIQYVSFSVEQTYAMLHMPAEGASICSHNRNHCSSPEPRLPICITPLLLLLLLSLSPWLLTLKPAETKFTPIKKIVTPATPTPHTTM
jgi:hypothetical protein